jgi:hypothetical protein
MIELRPEVAVFAELMELKLRKHDARRGQSWKNDGTLPLLRRVNDEQGELLQAYIDGSSREVILEAVDLANFAMMIADINGSCELLFPELGQE